MPPSSPSSSHPTRDVLFITVETYSENMHKIGPDAQTALEEGWHALQHTLLLPPARDVLFITVETYSENMHKIGPDAQNALEEGWHALQHTLLLPPRQGRVVHYRKDLF
jgi:hypothetical protein